MSNIRHILPSSLKPAVKTGFPLSVNPSEAVDRGQLVKVTGYSASSPTVNEADENEDTKGKLILAMATGHTAADGTQPGAIASDFVVLDTDTSSYTALAPLYLTDEGALTDERTDGITPVGIALNSATLANGGKVLLAPGRMMPQMVVKRVTVTSTAAPMDISIGMAFAFYMVQVRTSAGLIRATGADAFSINGNNLRITFDASPVIQVNDVVSVIALP